MTPALAALIAGFVHVLSGPDHLAAMAPYATLGKGRAWRTGVRWGLGHTAGVLGVGLLALMLRDTTGVQALSASAESCVGIVLIGVGIWGVYRAWGAARVESHQHRHEQRRSLHGRAAFGVGTVHGLAGGSHVLVIVPALFLPSDSAAAAYLILFGAGSIVAMGLFSFFIGWMAGRPVASSVKTQSALLGLASVLALSVGAYWLVSVLVSQGNRELVALAMT